MAYAEAMSRYGSDKPDLRIPLELIDIDDLMKKMEAERKEIKQHKPLPAPNSDFYELVETLPAEELAIVKQVRVFMETKVAPIITKYWVDDAFPFELLPSLKET